MADDNPIFQMVGDPDFAKMPVAEQRKALAAHDSSFGQVGDDELNKFVQAHQRAHTGMPAGDLQAAHEAAAHTAPGTGTMGGTGLQNPDNSVVGGFFRRAGGMIKSGIASSIPVPSMDEIKQTADNPTFTNKLRLFAHSTPGIAGPSRMLEGQIGAEKEAAHQVGDQWSRGERARPIVTALSMADPLATGSVTNVNRLEDEGRNREAIGQGGFDALSLAAGSKPGGALLSKLSPRGMLGKNMDIAAPGEPLSPRQMLDAGRAHGINLDLADASGHGLPGAVKTPLKFSLGGNVPFARRQNANLGSLDNWAENVLDRFSPETGTGAGARVQHAFESDLQSKLEREGQIFDDLDRRQGITHPDISPIQEAAQKLIDREGSYFSKHPEEMPRKVWDKVQKAAQNVNDNWGDVHRWRSDLMAAYRKPDIMGTRAEGFLKQLVGAADRVLTQPDLSDMSPEDVALFREANSIHKGIKETYDNPEHPFYHAVRNQFGSQAAGNLTRKAPELAQQIHGALGPVAGDFTRSVAESILRKAPGGPYDFEGAQGRFQKYPAEYVDALFGPHAREMRELVGVGRKVAANPNPSGSARFGIPAGEGIAGAGEIGTGIATGHPLMALEPPIRWATEYGLSKAMNSPRVVDYFTGPRQSVYPRALPIATAAGATTMNDADSELARRLLRRGEMAGPR